MALALAYGCALILFVGLDFVWLGTMTPRFYKPTLGDVLLTDVNLKAAAAFYLFYPIGLVIFVIAPALKSGDVRGALVMGAGGAMSLADRRLRVAIGKRAPGPRPVPAQ
ncbi:MAG: DUF2177 family protein [Proteobacteria bacterium]|nr:DUF2177 family protein [Pseudomonadota bacterium]